MPANIRWDLIQGLKGLLTAMIHYVFVFRVVHTVRTVSVVLWCTGTPVLKDVLVNT